MSKLIRVWEVEFGSWTKTRVIANNAKEAMNKSIKHVTPSLYCQLHDVTRVEEIVSVEK